MDVTRTIKLKLEIPATVAQEFIDAFTAACNFASQVAFTTPRARNFVGLNRVVYTNIRSEFKLSAQIAQSVSRMVSGKYGAIKTAKKKTSKPVQFNNEPVLLQGGDRQRDFGFSKDGRISISTLQGRLKNVQHGFHPHLENYRTNWNLGGAYLMVRKNQVFLLVSFSKEVQEKTGLNNSVVGVDRGQINIAAVTDGTRDMLIGGRELLEKRQKYQDVKASIQKRKAQRSTSSLRKLLKRLSGRESRFAKDVDHVVSKQIVKFAVETGSPVIAMEELSGIRNTQHKSFAMKKRTNRWSFFRLEMFVKYKAEQEGLSIIKVDAKYTSQACSKCGHTERANRSGESFVCKACGLVDHSDLNGARNIRLRGILARQVGGGAVSHPEVAALNQSSDLPGDKLRFSNRSI